MELDLAAIEQAKTSSGDGAVTQSVRPHAEQICKLLNDSLATEWVCVLRYRRHHFTAKGMASPAIADEFLVHANQELAHADKIAERIVQLGGEPQLDPSTLKQRSHADYDESADLKAMIRADLVAERVAIETYRQMIRVIGEKDPTTRRLLEFILEQEEEHAEELSDWLGN
jgi:bacterioferritin